MTQLSKLTCKIILVFLSSAYLMSCTGGNVSSSFGSSSSGSLVDQIPAGMSDGIMDPSVFYIGIDSSVNDIAHVHQAGDFSSACSINPQSTLNNITCMIEVPEAELYMHGLVMKYNVPAGMCRYLERSTYWYYNNEVGYGPSSIEINRTYTDTVLTASSCRFDGVGGFGSCSGLEAVVNATAVAPEITCVYDHSKQENGRNGCLGTYALTVTTTTIITTTAPPTNTTVSSNSVVSWGGSVKNLLGGAARYDGWPINSYGYPMIRKTAAHLGLLNNLYTLPAPINSIGVSTTMELANYSTPALNSHDGFVLPTVSTYPYALDPIDDFSGDAIEPGHDNYTFECLDQADEVLNRVSVYVREWDTYQDYYDYITTKGVTEVPDRRVGNEGGNCTGISGPCNDYLDLDDLASLFVSYSTTLPGDLNRRPAYFPQIPSK